MQAIDFFRTHCAICQNPDETPEQARDRCAADLVAAEGFAAAAGVSFHWDVDPEVTSADWCGDEPAHSTWRALARDCCGQVIGSLGCVDFGPDGEPWSSPYRRVVEAEIAAEYMLEAMVSA